MAYELPPLAVTGAIITAAWGNATRSSIAETAPAKATTKGDLWAATGLNAGARVGFTGTDGQFLITDASEATGWSVAPLEINRFTQPHNVSGAATLLSLAGIWSGANIGSASADGSAYAALVAWEGTGLEESSFSLTVYLVSPQTGTLRFTYAVSYAASGQDKDTHTVTSGGTLQLSMTADQIAKVSIASLSGIADNDYVAIQFERKGTDGGDDLTDCMVIGFMGLWVPKVTA